MRLGFVRSCSSWLPLGALVLGSACGPLVILDDEGSGDESSETGEDTGDPTTTTASTTTASTTTASTTTASTTSATSSTTSASTTSTTAATTDDPTGNEPSYCGQVCNAVDDCVYPGGNPGDWACIAGFCEYVGEFPSCDPATCDDLQIGVCSDVDGIGVCTTPCTNDSACLAGFTECTGTDDAGNSICEVIPCSGAVEGGICFIEGFGQYGVCTDGLCTCTDDSQCTAEGFACNH